MYANVQGAAIALPGYDAADAASDGISNVCTMRPLDTSISSRNPAANVPAAPVKVERNANMELREKARGDVGGGDDVGVTVPVAVRDAVVVGDALRLRDTDREGVSVADTLGDPDELGDTLALTVGLGETLPLTVELADTLDEDVADALMDADTLTLALTVELTELLGDPEGLTLTLEDTDGLMDAGGGRGSHPASTGGRPSGSDQSPMLPEYPGSCKPGCIVIDQ